ncbi:MAG: right-handed parallel beta-helix repeat-containing protein [Myxococcales bacterium]|nr:right-handed parallel beta-helix repeat-containing protein [Myxococcales bacterium]
MSAASAGADDSSTVASGAGSNTGGADGAIDSAGGTQSVDGGGSDARARFDPDPPRSSQLPPSTELCPDVPIENTSGAVYYVCDCVEGAEEGCVAGDDGQNGTSPDSPWRTMDKALAQFNSMNAGDIVALCRGGAFDMEPSDLFNEKCRADKRCVLRDYGPPWGGRARPEVMAMREGDLFAFEDGGDADHDEGYLVIGLALRGSGSGRGFRFYNDVDDVTVCDVVVDSFRVGVYAGDSNAPVDGSDGKNSRITLRASTIINNSEQGWLGGCDGCSLEYNYFENNGFAEPNFLHNLYLGSGVDQRVVGNELYRNALIDGTCQAVSLVVHGTVDGLLIEDNLVREDSGTAENGCWGISVDTGYDRPESFKNVTIRRNIVINLGRVGIGTNACQDCLIENNVIVNDHLPGVHIFAPVRERAEEDAVMMNVTVRNNSLYVADQQGTGISLGGEGSGHVAVSNSIVYAGGDGAWNCFRFQGDLAAFALIDNNLCNHSSGEWADGYGDLAAWQSASGMGSLSSTADARYTSVVPPYNLAPLDAESGLVDAGHATGSAAEDFNSAARSVPDIGAYELAP